MHQRNIKDYIAPKRMIVADNFDYLLHNHILITLKSTVMEKRVYSQPMAKVMSLNVHTSVCEPFILPTSAESHGPLEVESNASGVIFEN